MDKSSTPKTLRQEMSEGAAVGLHGLMEEVEQRLHLHLLVYEVGGADAESARVLQTVGDGLREILANTTAAAAAAAAD